jgi:hypothetical protein
MILLYIRSLLVYVQHNEMFKCFSFAAFPISIELARDTVSGFMALSFFPHFFFLLFYVSLEAASVSGSGNSLNRDSSQQSDVVVTCLPRELQELLFSRYFIYLSIDRFHSIQLRFNLLWF